MVDSGASTLFINKRWVKENGVATHKLQTPIPVYNIDGTLNQSGSITDMAVLVMKSQAISNVIIFPFPRFLSFVLLR